jgi:hypothetical protein
METIKETFEKIADAVRSNKKDTFISNPEHFAIVSDMIHELGSTLIVDYKNSEKLTMRIIQMYPNLHKRDIYAFSELALSAHFVKEFTPVRVTEFTIMTWLKDYLPYRNSEISKINRAKKNEQY